MFNAAFLNTRVIDEDDLALRLDYMRRHFQSRGSAWSFWVCDSWLDGSVQRKLSRLCERRSLRLSAEMPGMIAPELAPPRRELAALEFRRVSSARELGDFRAIGALCFHVPPEWFAEVFDDRVTAGHSAFEPWVAYDRGLPVATAAVVRANGALGLYNIATDPSHRRRGVAEAITRHVCASQRLPIVLQSTASGFRMYQRLGFRSVTRILVYNST